MQVSYSGYYAALPRLRYGFDSRYLLQTENSNFFAAAAHGELSLSLTGNLEVLPSAKSKKLAIKPNGILFILPFGFIPRSARRISTSSAKKPPWNLSFPWAAAAKKLEFSVWSCLYEEVRTYFEKIFKN